MIWILNSTLLFNLTRNIFFKGKHIFIVTQLNDITSNRRGISFKIYFQNDLILNLCLIFRIYMAFSLKKSTDDTTFKSYLEFKIN